MKSGYSALHHEDKTMLGSEEEVLWVQSLPFVN